MRKVWGIAYDTPGVFEELLGDDCLEIGELARATCKHGWQKTIELPYRVNGTWSETRNWIHMARYDENHRNNYNEPSHGSVTYWLCAKTQGNWYFYCESQNANRARWTDGFSNVIRPVLLFENRDDAMLFKLTFDFKLEADET